MDSIGMHFEVCQLSKDNSFVIVAKCKQDSKVQTQSSFAGPKCMVPMSVIQHQCDLMASLFVNIRPWHKMLAKAGSKFCPTLNKPSHNSLRHNAKIAKFSQIWSH